ncbi:MAG: hypothetical protein QNJ38_01230 [Prochloraceae cyanobacterium]|nr:hypothetical protein [Prochloraceae cyanobacterium]
MKTELLTIDSVNFKVVKGYIPGHKDLRQWTLYRDSYRIATIAEDTTGYWLILEYLHRMNQEDNDFKSPIEAFEFYINNEF